jgi:hypothetical protein
MPTTMVAIATSKAAALTSSGYILSSADDISRCPIAQMKGGRSGHVSVLVTIAGVGWRRLACGQRDAVCGLRDDRGYGLRLRHIDGVTTLDLANR